MRSVDAGDLRARATELAPPARWITLVLGLEFLAVVGYVATPGSVTDPRYVAYPFLWMNVGLLGVAVTSPRGGTLRRGCLAVGLATAYVLALAYVTGLVGLYPGPVSPPAVLLGLDVSFGPPGWAPRISYVTETFHLYFVPYRVVGYLALGYLVYAAVLDASAAALSGVVGVGSCISCTFPLVAPEVASVLGLGVGATVGALSVDVSTALYCLAVALLVWRPAVAYRME